MSRKTKQVRDRFKEFLSKHDDKKASQWLSVVDFGLKVLLQSVGELSEEQEVYDVTDLERVSDWRDKMRSEKAWIYIDEQNHGQLSKGLRWYGQFVEFLDLSINSTKEFKPAKSPETTKDDTEEPEPGVKVSRHSQTISITTEVKEGEAVEVTTTKYERSRLARKLCIEAYGSTYRCEVCGFRLADKYGPRKGREDYIEVHHIVEHASASKASGEHAVNYRNEMIPLCPNCHRMIHHLKDHTIHPDELRDIINSRKQ